MQLWAPCHSNFSLQLPPDDCNTSVTGRAHPIISRQSLEYQHLHIHILSRAQGPSSSSYCKRLASFDHHENIQPSPSPLQWSILFFRKQPQSNNNNTKLQQRLGEPERSRPRQGGIGRSHSQGAAPVGERRRVCSSPSPAPREAGGWRGGQPWLVTERVTLTNTFRFWLFRTVHITARAAVCLSSGGRRRAKVEIGSERWTPTQQPPECPPSSEGENGRRPPSEKGGET
jgi:hypothetical protein